jgi:hypothetical protein
LACSAILSSRERVCFTLLRGCVMAPLPAIEPIPKRHAQDSVPQMKLGHSQNQTRPLRSETGQHPSVDGNKHKPPITPKGGRLPLCVSKPTFTSTRLGDDM